MLLDLVVLAGGLGARYQGDKQFEGVGPGGQFLLHYSLYDAYFSGFTKAVFVLHRKSLPQLIPFLREQFKKIPIQLEFVYQTNQLLETLSYYRGKPWGTTHAMWSARTKVTNPFLIINSDDFYGRDSFMKAAQMLQKKKTGLISYPLYTTVSGNGGVSRGVCTTDSSGRLQTIQEIHQIQYEKNVLYGVSSSKEKISLLEETPTSMNLFFLQPVVWKYVEKFIEVFGKKYCNDLEKECYLSEFMGELSQKEEIWVTPSESSWFGITYPRDKIVVQKKLQTLHQQGVYVTQF